MNKNKTITIFIFSLIASLFIAAIFLFFFKIIKNKNEHTSAVLTALENKILIKQNANAITEKKSEIEATQVEINSHFVNPFEIDSFVEFLENLGTNAGTTVKVKSVEIAKAASNTISIEIEADGDFSPVMRTIRLLENSPYKIHIDRMNLTKDISSVTETVGGVEKTKEIKIWKANIYFNTLSS